MRTILPGSEPMILDIAAGIIIGLAVVGFFCLGIAAQAYGGHDEQRAGSVLMVISTIAALAIVGLAVL